MSSPPENWRAVRMFLVGSLVPGSTHAVDFIDHGLQVHETRAAVARENARLHTERVRKGIREAAGALRDLHDPRWPGWVADRIAKDPAKYGLTKVPCDDVIRAEWALLKIEAKAVP